MKTRTISRILAATAIALPSALFAIDTDLDGLDDSVETNTNTYVSPTNTGTNPNNPDSDGDGAGDWYEVTASFTNPTSAGSKPNIPYPLPAPDASTGATNKPVKVFILSGQSNMEGQGNISPQGTAGTLETITKNEHKFPNLLNGANWSVRNDVRYRGVVAAIKNELLTAGEGADSTAIGPELGFGHVMGYFHGEPVLILKSSEGGKSLGGDFLPPGSVQYTYGSNTYPGFGQSPISWATGSTPVNDPAFYGGIQFDKCFRAKADWAPAGASLPAITNVTDVLDNFATEYPQWATQGFEIAGFAWFHGWNDGLSYTGQYAYLYEQNMAQFIRQIRTYYEGRYPGRIKAKAPFVIATAAFEGTNPNYLIQYPTRKAVFDAQIAVANYPEFAGNVKSMDALKYWREAAVSPIMGGGQGYHYNRNAETFMLVGDALGRGMIDLLNAAAPDTTPPAILTLNPLDNATGVANSADLILTFNESVLRGSGNITLKNLDNSAETVIPVTDPQISITGAVLTINPDANLATSTNYSVQIGATAFVDLATNPFGGIGDDTTWNFTTAAPDTTPPTPDPLTWASPPAAVSGTSITMTATTASDPSGVEYFFDCTTAGGHDSAWQNSATYADSGLIPNTAYTYQVQARDKSAAQSVTAFSTPASATTLPPAPVRVAAFDVNSGASPTLTGYQAMSVSGATMTGTQNSITVAVTGSESFSARDRGVFPGGPLQDMLRDFAFVNDPAPISMTIDLSGLQANTLYEITTYSYNHGAFQTPYSVYANSVSEPNLIGTKTTTIGPSAGSDGDTGFTFSLTSDVDGKIRFVETAPAGGIVVFNGMTIDSLALVGFSAWQTVNSTAGAFNADHDNDGVPNGIEYFLGGPSGNTTGFTALPGVVNTNEVRSITWIKGSGYTGVYPTDFFVETSETLTGTWTPETLGVAVTITDNDVKFTFPSPLETRKFVRLRVTGP